MGVSGKPAVRIILDQTAQVHFRLFRFSRLFITDAEVKKHVLQFLVIREFLQNCLKPAYRSFVGAVLQVVLADQELIVSNNISALFYPEFNDLFIGVAREIPFKLLELFKRLRSTSIPTLRAFYLAKINHRDLILCI